MKSLVEENGETATSICTIDEKGKLWQQKSDGDG